jgi:uncharacterized protein YoxC
MTEFILLYITAAFSALNLVVLLIMHRRQRNITKSVKMVAKKLRIPPSKLLL